VWNQRSRRAVVTRETWKSAIAWSYLMAALILLPLLVEFLLEQVGVIHGPTLQDELPDSVFMALMFDAIAVGVLILLYWPIAGLIVLFYWNSDRQFTIPAVLFLVGNGLLLLDQFVLALPDSGPLFRICIASGWLFVIAAIRAWFVWVRMRI
jgi:hypothetical protein